MDSINVYVFERALDHENDHWQHYGLKAGNRIIIWNQTIGWYENFHIVNDAGQLFASMDYSLNPAQPFPVSGPYYLNDPESDPHVLHRDVSGWTYIFADEGPIEATFYDVLTPKELGALLKCAPPQVTEITNFLSAGIFPIKPKKIKLRRRRRTDV